MTSLITRRALEYQGPCLPLGTPLRGVALPRHSCLGKRSRGGCALPSKALASGGAVPSFSRHSFWGDRSNYARSLPCTPMSNYARSLPHTPIITQEELCPPAGRHPHASRRPRAPYPPAKTPPCSKAPSCSILARPNAPPSVCSSFCVAVEH